MATIEEAEAHLPSFREKYLGFLPFVVGTEIGAQETRRGKERIVFRLYLSRELRDDEVGLIRHSFKRIPIQTIISGSAIAF